MTRNTATTRLTILSFIEAGLGVSLPHYSGVHAQGKQIVRSTTCLRGNDPDPRRCPRRGLSGLARAGWARGPRFAPPATVAQKPMVMDRRVVPGSGSDSGGSVLTTVATICFTPAA